MIPCKESIFTFLCFQKILEQIDSTVYLIYRSSCFCLRAYGWISLLLKRLYWWHHLGNIIVHIPSGCLSPLYLLDKPSSNLEPLIHYMVYYCSSLDWLLRDCGNAVQFSFWSEETFFLRPYLPDSLQLNLSGVYWAQEKPNKEVTVLMKISLSLLGGKT